MAAFYWEPWAVAGTLGILLGWALAAVIYAMNPRRAQNRYLALFMATLAAGLGIACGLMFASASVRMSFSLQVVGLAVYGSSVPFYFLFLGTLPTRTVSWLRRRSVKVVLWAWAVAVVPVVAFNTEHLIAGVVSVPYARYDTLWTELATRTFQVQALLTATYGLLAAFACIAESRPGSLARRQAKLYALAFGWWEGVQLIAYTLLEVAFRSAAPDVRLYTWAAAILLPAALLGFLLLLAYAILKAQLFDIDLRVKLALSKGTIGAVFVAVFFVVSKLTESLADRLFGGFGWVLGAVAAGLMLFALRPLERLATRVADTAMPNTQDTAAYTQFRKMEVYKATLESFIVDGQVTARERDALRRLAGKLGIRSTDADALERDLLAIP